VLLTITQFEFIYCYQKVELFAEANEHSMRCSCRVVVCSCGSCKSRRCPMKFAGHDARCGVVDPG
jgi:hypothetical protein